MIYSNSNPDRLCHGCFIITFLAATVVYNTCISAEFTLFTIQTSGDQFLDPLLFPLSGQTSATFYSFSAPKITPGGKILYSANLSFDPDNDVLFDTFDSLWTASLSNPTAPQLLLRWGDEASLIGWTKNISPFDAPIPLHSGKGQDRILPIGMNEKGDVFFQGGRFGFSESSNLIFSQEDRNIIWQRSFNGLVTQKWNAGSKPNGDPIPIDFEHYSNSTDKLAFVAETDGPNGNTLASETSPGFFPTLTPQNAVANNDVHWYVDGFGNQGDYAFTTSIDLYLQSGIGTRNGNNPVTQESVGIWQLSSQTPATLQPVIEEGGLALGHLGPLTGIRPGTATGYGLQTTPLDEVGFLADGGLFLGSGQNGARKIVPEGEQIQAIVGGDLQNVILSKFDDLLIAPEGTIYFEAEAQIRKLPFPFEEANFLWRLVDGVPEAIIKSGEPIDPNGPPNVVFGTKFSLRDANNKGELLFSAQLERSGGVNSTNDGTLFLFRPAPDQSIARQRVLISREDGSIGPVALRGESLSDKSDVVFRLADASLPFTPNDDSAMLARFLPTINADFNGDGNVDQEDLNIWKSGFGIPNGATILDGDADGDGAVTGNDILEWQKMKTGNSSGDLSSLSHQVPEPRSGSLLVVVCAWVALFASQEKRWGGSNLFCHNRQDRRPYCRFLHTCDGKCCAGRACEAERPGIFFPHFQTLSDEQIF